MTLVKHLSKEFRLLKPTRCFCVGSVVVFAQVFQSFLSVRNLLPIALVQSFVKSHTRNWHWIDLGRQISFVALCDSAKIKVGMGLKIDVRPHL